MEIIEPKEIKTFKDFSKYIERYKNENQIRLYRGHKEERWNLESRLFSFLKTKRLENDFYKFEKRIFTSFKRELIRISPLSSKLTDWEILSIGRHYGLLTRLIDWTSNPLIALWFAFEGEKNNNEDRIVWGLVLDDMYLADFEKDDPFSGRFVKVFRPNNLDIRVIAQESWFSVQNLSMYGRGGDGIPESNEYNIINQMEEFDFSLARIRIPNEQRENILNELNKLGINKNSIYPDLKKICEDIELKEFK